MVNGPPAARVRQPFATAVLQRDEWPSNMFIFFSSEAQIFMFFFCASKKRRKKEGGKKQSALAIAFVVAT